MMITDTPLVVPEDLSVVPARDLPATVRDSLGGDFDTGGAVLGRRSSRLNATFVNSAVLRLIAEFHDPTPVVTAVIRHARHTGTSPERVLDECYPALVRLRHLGLLTSADDPDHGPIHQAGEDLGRWKVVDCLQSYEDSDVYTAGDASGELVVCKLGRTPGDTGARCPLRHEAAVLRTLRGRGVTVPELVAFTRDRQRRPLLVMQHIRGRRVDHAAQTMRRADMPRLLKTCARTAGALSAIHAAGMLHGDVHGGNYLLGPDDVVWAIDFPYACPADAPSVRHGVPRLMDPQWARARITGSGEVLNSPAGEQYSMAALLYFLITGTHHYPFVHTERELLESLADGTLRRHSAEEFDPALRETLLVLERGLRRQPDERWPDLAEFSAALTEATDRGSRRIGERTGRLRHRGREHLQAYLSPSASSQSVPPAMASGCAGTASTLWYMSCLTDDPTLLASSVLWTDKALAGDGTMRTAPTSPVRETGTRGSGGAWHGTLGVLGCAVDVSRAFDDRVARAAAARAYLAEHGRHLTPHSPLDLTHGAASCLLMDAHVLDAMPDDEVPSLREAGDRVAGRLGRAVADADSAAGPGLAHGAAGWLLALLAWQAATGRTTAAPGLLDEPLQAVRHAVRERLEGRPGPLGRWCRPGWEASWCNGASGLCLLFLAAAQTLERPDFLQAADDAMRVALDAEPRGLDLCCGYAGRLYALRRLSAATGRDIWRDETERDARAVRDRLPALPDHGFTKGRPGALAALATMSDLFPPFPLVDAPLPPASG
ncbi:MULTISPECIES: lanthionine synthetase LanC family protein [Streptomyces]|uniref:non-specific serine/threonine protein kinase n=2 Tax=Streptomyces TaxID=1883 RepID=A0ABT9LGA6_STRGD|nr:MULTISPECIES: lanthionine synthetase LanC family protein [Streptomyces]MDP9681787.1 hypothetical protein [Streptomyces griseoviridis]GGU33599.1 hypothetical protein GCM10010259_25060 [Streptomyces daghestanicus]GHI34214.1 hypothetical protein Sdagh_59440 [Streptomyces daghestanicus]